MILTNPNNPSETFDTNAPRKKGRPAKWLTNHPEYLALKYNLKPLKETVRLNIDSKNEENNDNPILHFWQWVGQEDVKASTGCYVAAFTKIEAIKSLNKTFKNPVGIIEMDSMWKEIKPTEFMRQELGVYQLKEGLWSKR